MKLGSRILALALGLTLGGAAARAQTMQSQEGWNFNPLNVKRDPFMAPSGDKKEAVNELRRFDLNEINLVAVLMGLGAPQAMVVLPNKKTHIVQVNDPIGRHNGRIYRITPNEVVVQEAFKDFKGRDKKSLTSLMLAP